MGIESASVGFIAIKEQCYVNDAQETDFDVIDCVATQRFLDSHQDGNYQKSEFAAAEVENLSLCTSLSISLSLIHI